MHRNKSVNVHEFAMIPRAEIPRSSFRMQKVLKTSFDGGLLIPVLCEEVLPGDTFNLNMTAFCRLATPIFPFLDNLYLESFFFFVPNRLVWDNWQKFMGEQANPGDSTSYTIPVSISPAGGYALGDLQDYYGLPTAGQINPGSTFGHNVLPLRGYNLIWNEWFRDQNLQNSASVPLGDGPDLYTLFGRKRRGKRHDYFTSCLPFAQKGAAVGLPLGGFANVISSGDGIPTFRVPDGSSIRNLGGGSLDDEALWMVGATPTIPVGGAASWDNPKLRADLSTATAATINALRQAFQIQKLLERDARGGTRYTEIVFSHFGVKSPDARLQRPEYLGGGRSSLAMNAIPQTSATAAEGTDTPQGNLAAMGTFLMQPHGFTQSFTEHGYVHGFVSVRADLTYQQGLRKHWSRQTRYDFYWPAFAMLGEQAVLNKEIYMTAIGGGTDNDVFGYQERWAEYRYLPSEITSLLKSTAPNTIDAWHLAQKFLSVPVLNNTFIEENPPLTRVLAVGAEASGQQILCDCFFDVKAARPLPMYSVPGLIDHF